MFLQLLCLLNLDEKHDREGVSNIQPKTGEFTYLVQEEIHLFDRCLVAIVKIHMLIVKFKSG